MTRKVYSRSKNNKYNRNPRYTKKIVQSGGDQTTYTIEAPPNDQAALTNAQSYFTEVAASPIVKQAVSGSGITVNTFVDGIKKIEIKRRNGEDTPLEIISHSPADGGTIIVKTPYKIVNNDDYSSISVPVGTVKYVAIIPTKNVTKELQDFLKTQTQGVLKTKGTDLTFVSDESIKTFKNIRDHPELGGETYISLKLPSGGKISQEVTETGNDWYGSKKFTQKITGVGADIIGEFDELRKGKDLDFTINGSAMKVTPKPGSKIDKIVNIDDYGITVPDGTVKYVDVFTNPSDNGMGLGLMPYLKKQENPKNGIFIKTKQTGDKRTVSFISDKSIREKRGKDDDTKYEDYSDRKEVINGKTYLALKLPTGKVEEPVVLLTVTIDPEEKKNLSKFLIQNHTYKVYDAAGNDVTTTLELESGEKSEELLKIALKKLLITKPEILLKALNDMPPSFSFINVDKPDEKFKSLYKVLIGDNDGLKVKGTGLFSKSTPIITKPTDNPTIFILYHLLVTLDKISSDVVKKNAAAQFFNSLKEIFNSLYKGKEPPKESAAVKIESFIRKLYDPSYSQTKTNAETLLDPAALLRNTYTVALDVANLLADKVTKSFESPVKGGRLTRRRVLNRRNKKKSHRSKLN